PSQGVTVDATLVVRPGDAGGKQVRVSVASLEVDVEIAADGRVVGGKVPAQGIEVRREGAAAPPPPVAPKPAAGVFEEPFETTRGGVALRGVLWLPAGGARAKPPLLVIIAGSGPTDRDGNSPLGLRSDVYRQLAGALVVRGAAVLRYDKRG